MGTLLQDLRYSFRMLARNPGFTTVAVVTLALGIGGTTAMFTAINAVLLKPLPYPDRERLVYLSLDNPRRNGPDSYFTLERFEELRSAARAFSALGAFGRAEDVTLSGNGEPEAVKGARVSANFLDILGVKPLLGRSFLSEEDKPGGPPVAMISAELWKRRFGGDPLLVGKTASFNSQPTTVVGVLPRSFEFPFTGVDVWFTRPAEWSVLPLRFWRFVNTLSVLGRLKPGISLEQARAEAEVLNQAYILAHPANGLEQSSALRVLRLKDRLVANARLTLWTLFAAVGFVLLIGCTNLASLLLARAASRSREFAVRAAIGAGRSRLIRQLLAESLLLAAAGGVMGIWLAQWALGTIGRVIPLSLAPSVNPLYLPGSGQIRLDSRVLAFTAVLSVATGVLFGLFPALGASRPDLAGALREGSEAGRATFPRREVLGISARGLLVTAEVALSIILLIGAALLTGSFARLRSVDPGFRSANLLTMKITLPLGRYDTDQKKAGFFRQLAQRVEAMAGVPSAAIAMSLPTTAGLHTNIISVEGRFLWNESEPPTSWQFLSVTPGYFRTLGIPLLRGREFTGRDNGPGAPPVVIINESFARKYWPEFPRGPDPVGRHMTEGADARVGPLDIVGVVGDVHEGGFAHNALPQFYLPCVVHPPQSAFLVVRTPADPMDFVKSVRSQVLAIDQDQPVSDIRTMDDVLDNSVGQQRLTMLLLGAFAAMGMLLAVVGVYGMVSYFVAQRTHEVGIRRALGAQSSDILRLVIGKSVALTLTGVAVGCGGAVGLNRVMKHVLFHMSPTDPATFVGVALLFIAVALVASYIPARRATKVDPLVALRYE